ncbi:hypothetical protein DSC_02550 [Pseudoxanthomonas spadix BD-a59]|uniref:Uncharacterized protein n=1 Tax=Pseudoxanthomonas spadix (strain BD-a59) TaxID=1045855 RepID=G7UVP6_PSEUP|nr:hypothetical protein DSC_02550 [Pseudoxanthomonas spadix BD-a59]
MEEVLVCGIGAGECSQADDNQALARRTKVQQVLAGTAARMHGGAATAEVKQ